MKKIESVEEFFNLFQEDIHNVIDFQIVPINGEDEFELDDSVEDIHLYYIPYNRSLSMLAQLIIEHFGYEDMEYPVEVSLNHRDIAEEGEEPNIITYLNISYYFGED